MFRIYKNPIEDDISYLKPAKRIAIRDEVEKLFDQYVMQPLKELEDLGLISIEVYDDEGIFVDVDEKEEDLISRIEDIETRFYDACYDLLYEYECPDEEVS